MVGRCDLDSALEMGFVVCIDIPRMHEGRINDCNMRLCLDGCTVLPNRSLGLTHDK